MSIVHEQYKSTVVQTVAQHSAACHKLALSYRAHKTRAQYAVSRAPCAVSRAQCAALFVVRAIRYTLCRTRSVATSPSQPGRVATPKDCVTTLNG